jgi:hypothetical protein
MFSGSWLTVLGPRGLLLLALVYYDKRVVKEGLPGRGNDGVSRSGMSEREL